jgi:hypothetical protein
MKMLTQLECNVGTQEEPKFVTLIKEFDHRTEGRIY